MSIRTGSREPEKAVQRRRKSRLERGFPETYSVTPDLAGGQQGGPEVPGEPRRAKEGRRSTHKLLGFFFFG